MPDELASEGGAPRNKMRSSRNMRICRSFIELLGVSAQARWLIKRVKPWFSSWTREEIATASSGLRPSRFMPVSTCSAAPAGGGHEGIPFGELGRAVDDGTQIGGREGLRGIRQQAVEHVDDRVA